MRGPGLALLVVWLASSACSPGDAPVPFPPEEEPAPSGPEPPPRHDFVEPGEELPGGATTVVDTSPEAFTHPAANLSVERRSEFLVGEAFFEVDWLVAPNARTDRDGLGPLYHAVSCLACHQRNGRGAPPSPGEGVLSLLVRMSVPGADAQGAPVPEPTYGDQLQPRAVAGVPPEASVQVRTTELPGAFEDGEPYALEAPEYVLTDLAHGPLRPDTRLSPRVAQPVFGLGLLAAVPEALLLEWADAEDANGDGISGRPNRVWNRRLGQTVLGRFGWKANQPNLEHQNAGALAGDMGLTSPLAPSESCTSAQAACLAAPNGGTPEVDARKLTALTFYTHVLGVPARQGVDVPRVLRGKELFHRAGCARCHRPSMETGALEGHPELSHQLIWPYTDLLLHDMGAGLADGREDFAASGQEWRTPPLWGLGRTAAVSGHTRLLHDGRARSVMEAILWHGGEAEASREHVRRLTREERTALLAFLESL
ncbi:di-heme oxidoredictase family protein [Hyalangium minutum]|uniref:Putative thiol oxidoreductase with 2 cytochrome c heme-binding site n=1 Tax=Hyalangium minutum TaxID=394096 RepID=A0A085WUL0_9BACT|nr:di-heme oxidoredictase family protein [Hyalangium minutum]KFE71373.1 putative thiol oxidoreductase with 2 cytochrome c heme-binding site [Hyalangium minutum]